MLTVNPEPPTDPWNAPSEPAPSAQPAGIDAAHPEPPASPADPTPLSTFTRVRLGLAWACIAICTIVLLLLQSFGMQELQKQYADDSRPGFTALYMARYAAGVDQFAPGQARPLMREFDAIVVATPFPVQSQSRSVILAAEIDTATLEDRLEQLRTLHEQGPFDADSDADLILSIYDTGYNPTPDERDFLIERHGWFGEIAGTYNLPTNNPDYVEPRRSALFAAIGLIALFITVGFAGLAGLVLAIIAIVFLSTGKIRGTLVSGPTTHRSVYLELVALFLLCFIALQVVLGVVQLATGLSMMPLILVLSALPLLWPVLVRVPWRQYKQDMGYHTGRGLFREIGAGLVGYLAGLPIIALGMGIMFVLSSFLEATADHPMQYELMDGGPLGPWVMLIAAVVWAPLVEESVFRSAFHRHLRQHRGFGGFALASLVSGFVFAAIHPQGWVAIPTLMCIAFVLTYLREWRGSIIPSMVAHALHNGTIALMMTIILFV